MRYLLPLLSLACAATASTQAPPPGTTLTADIGVMHLGQPSHIRVHDAQPGETLYVVRANSITPGPCPAAMNGECVDVGPSAFLLGTMTADANGLAELEVTPPTSLPAGASVALQVIALRGGAPVLSEPFARTLVLEGDLLVEDLVAGDLAVTEVLQDPVAATDANGEWFEVLNTTSSIVDLRGLVITDDGSNAFTLNDTLLVEAGGRVVFGAETDRSLNGGVFVDVQFSSTTLSNTSDEIILSADGVELDRVAWDNGATFPDLAGIAMQTHLPDVNEHGVSWCEATGSFGAGDLGTPGLANIECPIPVDVDGDGFALGEDCDDDNADVYPGAAEICDGIDNDCDDTTTEAGLITAQGQNFTTIQSAISAWAVEIDICEGTYGEALTTERGLTLRGHGDVVFDGGNSHRILGIYPVRDSSGNSSRIYVDIEGIDFVNGHSDVESGGAIDTGNAVTLTISDAEFLDNAAAREGGAIAMGGLYWSNQRTQLNLTDVVFRNNESDTHGGAIYVGSSGITALRTIFHDNSAGLDGGAIWGGSNDTVVRLTDSELLRNSGVRGGGGVMLYSYHRGVLHSVNTDWGFGIHGNSPYDVSIGNGTTHSGNDYIYSNVANFTCEQETALCR